VLAGRQKGAVEMDCINRFQSAKEKRSSAPMIWIPIESLEHAVDVANGVHTDCPASISTRNVNRAFQATRDLYTRNRLRETRRPSEQKTHLPFGGTSRHGNGHREAALRPSILHEWKTIYIDYSDKLQRAQSTTSNWLVRVDAT